MARNETYVFALAAGIGCSWLCFQVYSLSQKLKRTEEALSKEQQNKKSERNGRIRFEQELRKVQVEAAAAGVMTGQHGGAKCDSDKVPSFPFKPIGYIKSCFSQRYNEL